MAKQPPVKCLYCGKSFYREEEEFVQVGRRYAHKYCAEHHIDYKQNIHNLMKNLLKEQYSYTKIEYQIKNIKAQEQTTEEEIYNVLDYWYNILHNSTEKANGGINIVPYIIGQYRKWALEKEASEQINKGKNLQDFVNTKPVEVIGKITPITRPRHVRYYTLD